MKPNLPIVIQQKWPAVINGKTLSYSEVFKKFTLFFKQYSIPVNDLNHFGIVVSSIDAALDELSKLIEYKNNIIKDYVAYYQVQVARVIFNNAEMEFIEPVGQSFFKKFLCDKGPGLNHISFEVKDILACTSALENSSADLIDKQPRSGSHGKVAFSQHKLLVPYYLEICQKIT